MNILVTGANSPLGSAVCHLAKRIGHCVYGVTRTEGVPMNIHRYLDEHLVIDLKCDSDFEQIPENTDAIVHVASLSEGSPLDLMMVTGLGTHRLISKAKSLGVRRVVCVSSMSVYGDVCTNAVSHDTPISHQSPYGLAKWASECFLRHEFSSVESVCVRSPAIVGRNSHRHFLAQLCNQMRSGVSAIKVSNPDFLFNNAVHTDELSAFLIELLLCDLNDYLSVPVCSSGGMQLREIVNVMTRRLRYRGSIIWTDSETQPFSIECSKAISLGFKPAPMECTLDRWLSDI